MSEPVILPLTLLAKLLPSRKARLQRVEVARRVHAVRTDEIAVSDPELWERLGDVLPEWAHSGVVAPVTIDELYRCLHDLDPRDIREPAEREAARTALRASLDGLYHVLISSDGITRTAREVGHHWRTNVRLARGWNARHRVKAPSSQREISQAVATSAEPGTSHTRRMPSPGVDHGLSTDE